MKRFSIPCAIGLLLAPQAIGSTMPFSDSAAPLSWQLTPTEIAVTCARELDTAKRRTAGVLALSPSRATFANSLLVLENTNADLSDHTATAQMLSQISSSKSIRDASQKCSEDASAFANNVGAQPKLFAILQAVSKKPLRNPADRKLLELYLIGAKRAGAGLSTNDRNTFLSYEREITRLGQEFPENVAAEQLALQITQAQSVGLPDDLIANAVKTSNGYKITVNESTYALFMPNERDPSAREAFYRLYNNRAAAKNVPLLEKAIVLRERAARLLGYATWADYVLDQEMAKKPQRVMSFLNDLDRQLLPAARSEITALARLKARDSSAKVAKIEAWDVPYYDNKLRQTRYALDVNLVRSYFPAVHTITSVLGVYSRVLGLRFQNVPSPNLTNADVLEYWVKDARSGAFIGTFYLDLYPRPGKFSHFANFPFLQTRRLANGSFRPAVSMIIGNWPQPARGKPSLLSHDDVVVFFHEFGHNMASLLSTAPYETLGGFRQDFIEAPSQMLENFVWDPTILREISSNVNTGKPMPDSLIHRLISTRFADNAYFTTRQIQFGTVDMMYHTATGPIDSTAVYKAVAGRTTPIEMPEGIHPQAAFTHLFGYDAAYYGYLWSKVYAQDLFTAFKRGGLENPAVGMRYRRDILEPAATYEPDVLVRKFLGRPMDPRAFYDEFKKIGR